MPVFKVILVNLLTPIYRPQLINPNLLTPIYRPQLILPPLICLQGPNYNLPAAPPLYVYSHIGSILLSSTHQQKYYTNGIQWQYSISTTQYMFFFSNCHFIQKNCLLLQLSPLCIKYLLIENFKNLLLLFYPIMYSYLLIHQKDAVFYVFIVCAKARIDFCTKSLFS